MAALDRRYDVSRSEISLIAASGAALVALLLALGLPFAAAAFSGLLASAMTLVALIDHRQFTIPDVLSLPAIPIGLLAAKITFGQTWASLLADHGLAALVAGGVFLAIRLFYRQFRGIEGLGLGDVKLAATAGAWLGLEALPMTCLLASASALVSALLLQRAGTGMKSRIAFGSFIAPAIVLMWLGRIAG